MHRRAFIAALPAVLATAFYGCQDIPPIPESHDPKGADLVAGAVIAATESSGGVRLNKVIHVDDYPPPLDYEFHMIAYDPKGATWEEASRLWKERKVGVIIKHFSVRRADFLTRDYRVLYNEPVTPQEKADYEASKNKYPVPAPRPSASAAASSSEP